MAHFIVKDEETGIEVRWDDGIVTSNNEIFLEGFLKIAEVASTMGKFFPESEISLNPLAPPHTKDMMFILALLIYDTHLPPALPGAELVELSKTDWPTHSEDSTLPGGVILY